MKISMIPASHLSASHVAAWNAILLNNPDLGSPFFRPEYTQLMSRLRVNVEVAVLGDDSNSPMGFFPYERKTSRAAGPVGAHLSDYQGFILPLGLDIDVPSVLRACQLSVWNFDHVVASQPAVKPYHWRRTPSPVIRLPDGYEAYLARKKQAKCRRICDSERKERKLAREHGDVRFEPHVVDDALLERLIRWKREQYRQTGVRDAFEDPWTIEFLHELLHRTDENFCGMLSALRVDDKVVALHFGIRSRETLHSFIPTYDIAYERYSPGIAMFRRIFESAPSLGIETVDLGKGSESYKYSLMTDSVDVAEGSVDLRPFRSRVRRRWSGFRQRVVSSRFRSQARTVARCAAKVCPPLHAWLQLR